MATLISVRCGPRKRPRLTSLVAPIKGIASLTVSPRAVVPLIVWITSLILTPALAAAPPGVTSRMLISPLSLRMILIPSPSCACCPRRSFTCRRSRVWAYRASGGRGITPRRSTGHACPNANMASAQLVSTIGTFSHVAGCRSVGKSSRDEGGRGVCLRDLRLLLLPHHDGLPAELADGERDVSPRYAKDGVDEIARLRCAKAFWSAIKSPAYPQLRLGGNPLHAMHRISCRESPLFSHKVREEGGIDRLKVKENGGVHCERGRRRPSSPRRLRRLSQSECRPPRSPWLPVQDSLARAQEPAVRTVCQEGCRHMITKLDALMNGRGVSAWRGGARKGVNVRLSAPWVSGSNSGTNQFPTPNVG